MKSQRLISKGKVFEYKTLSKESTMDKINLRLRDYGLSNIGDDSAGNRTTETSLYVINYRWALIDDNYKIIEKSSKEYIVEPVCLVYGRKRLNELKMSEDISEQDVSKLKCVVVGEIYTIPVKEEMIRTIYTYLMHQKFSKCKELLSSVDIDMSDFCIKECAKLCHSRITKEGLANASALIAVFYGKDSFYTYQLANDFLRNMDTLKNKSPEDIHEFEYL